MIIETVTEFEILGAIHALFFDAKNQRHNKTILAGTLDRYFKFPKRMEFTNQAIKSLVEKRFIIADKSTVRGVPEMEYGEIGLTEAGEKAAKAVIEPYWIETEWKTKYPRIKQAILPLFNEDGDWLIMKTLFRETSWKKAYKIDQEKAKELINKIKEPPFFGKFLEKFRNQSQIIQFSSEVIGGRQVVSLQLQDRIKPLVVEDFLAFDRVDKYYKGLLKLFDVKDSRSMTPSEFLTALKDYGGYVVKEDDADVFFDDLSSLGLMRANWNRHPDGTDYIQVMLDWPLGSKELEEWKYFYLRRELNPQQNFYNHLEGEGALDFNERTGIFKIRPKKQRSLGTFESMVGDESGILESASGGATTENEIDNNEIFIVHGHDTDLLKQVRILIENVGLDPIVLHEQPNQGKTLIEKFEKHSDVGFAVILLTPDDKCLKPDGSQTVRARQNVILELGYFLGKLGRTHVCALLKEGVETPSDYDGVVYVKVDNDDKWKRELLREIKASGYELESDKEIV